MEWANVFGGPIPTFQQTPLAKKLPVNKHAATQVFHLLSGLFFKIYAYYF